MMIHFARHAQSTFNRNGGNELNSDITSEGKTQSKSLNQSYDLVIISNLLRTRRTLDCSNVKYKTVIVSDLCREKKESNCDFLPGEDMIRESHEDFLKRIEKFREEVKNYSKEYDRILIISHYTFGIYFTGYYLSNCGILDITNII